MNQKKVPMCLFNSRPVVAGLELKPLTAGRVLVLEGRGHPLAVGMKAGDVVTKAQMFELVLVASLDDRELAELHIDGDDREWKIRAAELSMQFQTSDLERLWQIVEREVEEIEAAKAGPKKKNAGRAGDSSRPKKKATPRTGG